MFFVINLNLWKSCWEPSLYYSNIVSIFLHFKVEIFKDQLQQEGILDECQSPTCGYTHGLHTNDINLKMSGGGVLSLIFLNWNCVQPGLFKSDRQKWPKTLPSFTGGKYDSNLLNANLTRMHSSRMRTVRCSGHLLGSVCQTPPWTEWQTRVKTFPCRNYVADGKNVPFPTLANP